MKKMKEASLCQCQRLQDSGHGFMFLITFFCSGKNAKLTGQKFKAERVEY